MIPTLILNVIRLLTMRNVAHLLRLLAVSCLLVGCTEINNVNDRSDKSKSAVGLGQTPSILTRAVDSSQLRPIVTMNWLVVAATRGGDENWFLNYELFDTSLKLEMRWVENYNGQELTLASWSGDFNNITSDSSFMIPVDGYKTDSHDNDEDGISNLAERIANTDPYGVEYSAGDIRGVWVGECKPDAEDDGTFDQLSVTFGLTDYQLSAVSYVHPTTCSGDRTITVNLFGNYTVKDDVTEFTDGDANHLDIVHSSATLTIGAGTSEIFASQGITLQEFATEKGLGNVNDLPLDSIEAPDRIFTIFRINSNKFVTGIDSGLNNGLSTTRRHTMLDLTDEYIKL